MLMCSAAARSVYSDIVDILCGVLCVCCGVLLCSAACCVLCGVCCVCCVRGQVLCSPAPWPLLLRLRRTSDRRDRRVERTEAKASVAVVAVTVQLLARRAIIVFISTDVAAFGEVTALPLAQVSCPLSLCAGLA